MHKRQLFHARQRDSALLVTDEGILARRRDDHASAAVENRRAGVEHVRPVFRRDLTALRVRLCVAAVQDPDRCRRLMHRIAVRRNAALRQGKLVPGDHASVRHHGIAAL